MPNVIRVVGRYEVLREIGHGGAGTVYAARQPDLDREVALKELSQFHATSPELAHRFLREARLAGSLNHPNIVTVYEYFEHEGTPYIAMEYLSQGSLRRHISQLSFAQMAGVLEGVLAGLAHAEQAGIVHRDLKPENIMVTADGRVKIADFGIARATERTGATFMTATGVAIGTPHYMAPEQAMAGEIGTWTDLYAVGILAYELLVGRVPFHEVETPMAVLMRHVNEAIPPAIEVKPYVDPELSAWIDGLLVKDYHDRVRHAGQAWESLEDIVVRRLGPLWHRDARLMTGELPASGPPGPVTPSAAEPGSSEPAAPTAEPTTDPVAPVPLPAAPEVQAETPRRVAAARRTRVVIAAAGLLAALVAAAILLLSSGRGGDGLSAQVPGCVRDFLRGTARNVTLVLGLPNRYPQAATNERPVGLVLGSGRPVGAVRLIHHLQPQEYFEIQGALDASTCRSVGVRDLLRTTTANNITPYDDVQVDLAPRPYYIRPGAASSSAIEVDFTARRPAT